MANLVILAVYAVELSVNIFIFRGSFFCCQWNWLDGFIVAVDFRGRAAGVSSGTLQLGCTIFRMACAGAPLIQH